MFLWHTFGVMVSHRLIAGSAGILLCGLSAWSGVMLVAQNKQTVPDGGVPTLHVYANTIQIPVLVLGADRERIAKPIPASRFWVNFNDGPWFHATHVRLEEDDPISLSIVLDATGGAGLMPKIDDAIANLAPLSLHAKDHVSIYALDCELTRAANDVPADHLQLKDEVDRALESWTNRSMDKHAAPCRNPVHLWDAMAFISQQLYKLPGRRVILAVTDGNDKGSVNSWNGLRLYDQQAGIAVFGVVPIPRDFGSAYLERWSRENPFQALCELSGGIVVMTKENKLEQTLNRFMTMVRGRYIVEFPRPANSSAGEYGMAVKIDKSNDLFIRAAGISFPVPDAAVRADPTTVPSDPSRAPEIGKRRVLTTPN
ncbi:MAG TPA: hypothetical protein VIX42_10135 [Edaphobacter sp.]